MMMSTLLRKIREFYAENEWGRGALRTLAGEYCLLGAAACVVTNRQAIDTMTNLEAGIVDSDSAYADENAEFSHWIDIPNVKGTATLREFETFFRLHVFMDVDSWNDGTTPTRGESRTQPEVLNMLHRLEKIALKEELEGGYIPGLA